MKIRWQKHWRARPNPYWFFRRSGWAQENLHPVFLGLFVRGGCLMIGPLEVFW